GEKGCLVAAGTGADLEDGALLVGRVLGDELAAYGLAQARDPLVERLRFAPRQHPHFRIVEEGIKPLALGFGRGQLADRLVDRRELRPLAAELDQSVAVERRLQA